MLESQFIREYELSGKCCVEFCEWNSDFNAQAEHLARLAHPSKSPKFLVIAYSWGAGFGFTRFARHLRDRGVEISCAVLSDAVYHHGPRWCHTPLGAYFAQIRAYYPYFYCTRKLIKWKLLPPRPRIFIPDNVLHVEWFVQQNSKLFGHELYWQDSKTLCDGPHPTDPRRSAKRHPVPYRNHSNMDELTDFWDVAHAQAKALFLPRKTPRTKKGR